MGGDFWAQSRQLWPIWGITLLLVTLIEAGLRLLLVVLQPTLVAGLNRTEIALAWLWGVRFDAALAGLFWLVALLVSLWAAPSHHYRRFWQVLALLLGGSLLLHGADQLYFAEAGRHLGYEVLEGWNSAGSLVQSAVANYTGWVILYLLLLYLLVQQLIPRLALGLKAIFLHSSHFNLGGQLPLALLLAVVLIRGGVSGLPLEPLHAQQLGQSQMAAVALNGSYNALFSILTGDRAQPLWQGALQPTDQPQFEQLTAIAPLPPTVTPLPPTLKPHLVMLLLESWSGVYLSHYGYPHNTAPIFEQLRQQGVSVRAMVAGGRRTTEGMFATLCSWPNPLGQTVAQTQLQNYRYRCLPHILAEQGYQSLFVQGTNQNTSGVGAFAQLLGFKESLGKKEYAPVHYPPNSWGYHDEDIYHYTLERLQQADTPLLVGINTNSTHDQQMPQGVKPQWGEATAEERYRSLLTYADGALGRFVKELRQLKRPVLLVAVADHTGMTPADLYLGHLIPFALVGIGLPPLRWASDRIASQRDIAPTLLQLLQLPRERGLSGVSLFQPEGGGADYFQQGVLGWAEHNAVYEFNRANGKLLRCQPLNRQGLPVVAVSGCDAGAAAVWRRAASYSRLTEQRLFSGQIGQP